MEACRSGDFDTVLGLVDGGADIETTDGNKVII